MRAREITETTDYFRRREQERKKEQGVAEGYTGRETKEGTWRVFKDGNAVAVAGPFKSREEAAAWIKKQKQGVAEGDEQVYKVIAVDKSNALGRKVKLRVKANSVDEVFERLAMSDWYPLSINGAEVIDGRRLKKGVAEGSDNTAVIYDNGYVKIDGKMYKAKRMNHESGMGIAIQTPSKMYFSNIQNEYEMPSVTIHRALKLGGLNPVFNEGVAEGF